MTDAWQKQHGLNHRYPKHAIQTTAVGCINLELYFNSLV